jgi:hypothetical protein
MSTTAIETWRAIRRTTTETFSFTEERVREEFGAPPEGTSYEDWILELFYKHDGSLYGDEIFSSQADLDHGNELLPIGWDD